MITWPEVLRAQDISITLLFAIVAVFAFNWNTFSDARTRHVLEWVPLLASVVILAVEFVK